MNAPWPLLFAALFFKFRVLRPQQQIKWRRLGKAGYLEILVSLTHRTEPAYLPQEWSRKPNAVASRPKHPAEEEWFIVAFPAHSLTGNNRKFIFLLLPIVLDVDGRGESIFLPQFFIFCPVKLTKDYKNTNFDCHGRFGREG